MVHYDGSAVAQAHLFAAVAPGDQVDRGRGVMDDVNAGWRLGEKRTVEPLEVLAHQAAGQEMMGLNRLTRRVDRAPVADPAVALCNGPVVQATCVARLLGLGFERVQGELPAGVVEEEVVGLLDVVNARAGGSGLDHVHCDVKARPKLVASGRDHTLESADAP